MANTDEVQTLLDQLQDNTLLMQQVNDKKIDPLKKEEVEGFVIEKAGELVRESLETLKNMKDFVQSAPDSDSIAAIANLISATSTTLETLNKIVVIDKKTSTAIKTKQMEIDAKKEISAEVGQKFLMTREEVIKQLVAKVTPAVIDVTPQQKL